MAVEVGSVVTAATVATEAVATDREAIEAEDIVADRHRVSCAMTRIPSRKLNFQVNIAHESSKMKRYSVAQQTLHFASLLTCVHACVREKSSISFFFHLFTRSLEIPNDGTECDFRFAYSNHRRHHQGGGIGAYG